MERENNDLPSDFASPEVKKEWSNIAASLFFALYMSHTEFSKPFMEKSTWTLKLRTNDEQFKIEVTLTMFNDTVHVQACVKRNDGTLVYELKNIKTQSKIALDNRFKYVEPTLTDIDRYTENALASDYPPELWKRVQSGGGRGKRLGAGARGGVYAADCGIMKIEHILKSHVRESLASPYWREIEFAKAMAPFAPTFMTLVDSRIDASCRYKHAIGNYVTSGFRKRLKALMASPFCSVKRWTPRVDTTLGNLLNRRNRRKGLSDGAFRDFFIQVIHAVTLMEARGYRHTDLHFNNVGLVATREKTVPIRGREVPTHGFRVCRYAHNIRSFGVAVLCRRLQVVLESAREFVGDQRRRVREGLQGRRKPVRPPVLQALRGAQGAGGHAPLRNVPLRGLERLMLGDRFKTAVPPRLHLPEEDILCVLSNLDDASVVLDHFLNLARA